MKIAGFTIIRNAIKYDYPVVEAINSILILCDEFYVGVGKSDDVSPAVKAFDQLLQHLADPRVIVQNHFFLFALTGKLLSFVSRHILTAP